MQPLFEINRTGMEYVLNKSLVYSSRRRIDVFVDINENCCIDSRIQFITKQDPPISTASNAANRLL